MSKFEVYLEIIHITDRAYLVTDGGEPVWIPKCVIESPSDCKKGDTVLFTIPEWLALEKGFI